MLIFFVLPLLLYWDKTSLLMICFLFYVSIAMCCMQIPCSQHNNYACISCTRSIVYRCRILKCVGTITTASRSLATINSSIGGNCHAFIQTAPVITNICSVCATAIGSSSHIFIQTTSVTTHSWSVDSVQQPSGAAITPSFRPRLSLPTAGVSMQQPSGAAVTMLSLMPHQPEEVNVSTQLPPMSTSHNEVQSTIYVQSPKNVAVKSTSKRCNLLKPVQEEMFIVEDLLKNVQKMARLSV